MATAVTGKLDSFKEGEKITEYLERVELPFGVTSAKDMFQRTRHIKLVTGETDE